MIKVRFAPSPTGHLHIGGLRGALFNYYFAKKNKGKFVLRIEDTDQERDKLEYTQAIFDAFAWCGIASDEPIVFQSRRMSIYKKYLDILLLSGQAYYSEEIDENGEKSTVIKCKVDKSKDYIAFHDIVRGWLSFPISEIDDFIIVRSNGIPLYNFVVVVDDIDMDITHIIRGEEHLSNTPKQIILYQAFGKKIPKFAHLPLILGQDRKKLSKRDAATAVIDYKKDGFLPEALCMYLLRLGWAHGDQEFFTYDEILQYFQLEKVHHSGAIFDIQKLKSINHTYLKRMTPEELVDLIEVEYGSIFDRHKAIQIIALYIPRSQTLLDLYRFVLMILQAPERYNFDLLNIVGIKREQIVEIALIYCGFFCDGKDKDKKNIFDDDRLAVYSKHVLYTVLRFILIGIGESPSIVSIMNILGEEEIQKRINYFKDVCE